MGDVMDNRVKKNKWLYIVLGIELIFWISGLVFIYNSVDVGTENRMEINLDLGEINVSYYLVTFFPLLGISLPSVTKVLAKLSVQLADWKNRKCIKRILINNVTQETLKDNLKKFLTYVIELFMPVGSMLLLYGVISALSFFIKYRLFVDQITKEEYDNFFMKLISFIIIWLCFFMCKNIKKIFTSLLWIWTSVIVGMYFICEISFRVQSPKCLFLLTGVVVVCIIGICVCVFAKMGAYNNYHNFWCKLSLFSRYFFLAFFIIRYFIVLKAPNIDILMIVWSVLCIMEYFYILWYQNDKPVSVCIQTKDDKKDVVGKIIEYEGDRVKYTLLNGDNEIIDGSKIEEISYQRTLQSWEEFIYSHMKQKNIYISADNKKLNFQNYRMLDEYWEKFWKIENGKMNVSVLRVEKGECIVIKK